MEYSLSEYTQSVMGHGRQQLIIPCAEGIWAQNRPSITVDCKQQARIEKERVYIHPPVLENLDCSKKGGVHRPRSYVVFAMEARAGGQS